MSPPATPADDQGLTLHHVGVRFGGLVALDDVSLRVPPGRVVGVIGPNGAGKTTLFNVVCGFVRPTAGLAHPRRPAAAGPGPHRLTRLGIARTLQGVGLFAGLTVLENVMAGATPHARAGFASALFGAAAQRPRRARGCASGALDLLDRAGRRRRTPTRCPGTLPYAGTQAGRAGPRAGRPTPAAAARRAGRRSRRRRHGRARRADPRAAGRDDGCAVLLVEHHMDLVMAVCDEIVVLDFGQRDRRRHPGRDPRRPARSPRPTSGADACPQRGARARRPLTGACSRSRAQSPATAPVPVLHDVDAHRPGRHDHRRPRRQRRRQDHAAAHALRPGPPDRRPDPAATGEDLARRRRSSSWSAAGMAHVPEGRGVIAELTVDENLRLGGLWRRDRADAATALDRGLRAVPGRWPERRDARRTPALRRRAADARHRPRPDRPAAAAAARRAVARPGAPGRRADHGAAAAAARRTGADRAAGRAERAQRAVRRRPGRRACRLGRSW